jgi:hypothetical protein
VDPAGVYLGIMTMLRRLLPESIFARKLAPEVEHRLRLAQARADEAIVRTHVENALLFVDALAPELPFERALEVYVREMAIPEPLSSVVITRALVALGDGLMSLRGRGANAEPVVEREAAGHDSAQLPVRPRLRLDDATTARRRPA